MLPTRRAIALAVLLGSACGAAKMGPAARPLGAARPKQPGAVSEIVPPESPREPLLNLYRKDVPLREAIALIEGEQEGWSIDPDVPDIRVTVNLSNTTLQAGLRYLTRQVRLEMPRFMYEKEGIRLFRLRRWNLPEGPAEENISLHFKKIRLGKVLDRISETSDLTVGFEAELSRLPVTVEVERVPLRRALFQIVRQVAASVPNLDIERTEKNDRANWKLVSRKPVAAVQHLPPPTLVPTESGE